MYLVPGELTGNLKDTQSTNDLILCKSSRSLNFAIGLESKDIHGEAKTCQKFDHLLRSTGESWNLERGIVGIALEKAEIEQRNWRAIRLPTVQKSTFKH